MKRALLAIWGWDILTNKELLCLSVIHSKYLQYSSFLDASFRTLDSRFWKGVISIQPLIASWACKLIREGSSVSLWRDPLGSNHSFISPVAFGVSLPRCLEGKGYVIAIGCVRFKHSEDYFLPSSCKSHFGDGLVSVKSE